ncbi:UDP-N-acetylmuramate dehydrogenase [Collinsella provencensis]|uniref:UDP-N-acetylmuramate dehydrogenase n=1 Tax=Collinsella provencensis TaxID=1937461 RepID=UPI000C836701|nr:UDP-N-acetylmuramate dehydrogenase [Collinsella provencensis]
MHEYEYVSEEMLCVLAQVAGEDNVLMAEPMSAHTTFKIGGPADVVVTPRTTDALVRVLDMCLASDVPMTIVGNGSDLLVGDRGVRGVVVLLRDNLSKVEVDADHWRVTAEAGALLRDVALAAADAGLSGMEPLWGIPATVGGACFMNAGAYDGTTGGVLETVEVYVPSKHGNRGSVVTFEARDLNFGYRKSRIQDDGLIVLRATFKLSPSTPAMVRAAMDDYQTRREDKQPLDMPSAGSTFKRPEGYFAGKLIMDAGLRGVRVGGAQVSEKHCGFVVNAGGASAKDVLGLIEHVKAEVKAQFGVELEPEVRMVGEF